MKKMNISRLAKIHLFNPKDVQNAIKSQNVVIIVLRSGKSRISVVSSGGTKNNIEAINIYDVKRLISQSASGAGESKGSLNLFWKTLCLCGY